MIKCMRDRNFFLSLFLSNASTHLRLQIYILYGPHERVNEIYLKKYGQSNPTFERYKVKLYEPKEKSAKCRLHLAD